MAINTIPYEVLAGSGTVYLAPAGTALPAEPGGVLSSPWFKIGTGGDLNYDEDTGIEFTVTENVVPWTPLGSNAPRKYFRTVEGVTAKVQVADMTLEQVKYALNGNAITTVAAGVGTIGYKKIGLVKGTNITSYACIIRYNVSPYLAEGIMEFRHTLVQQKGEPKFVAKKGEPMLVDFELMSIADPAVVIEADRLGVWLAQHQVAGT